MPYYLQARVSSGGGSSPPPDALYIRPGAGGSNDGSDWANAFTSMPSSLQRNKTYYLAGGSFGSYTVDDGQVGEQRITLKKATAADHGTSAGWSDGYGSQTIFSSITITVPYVTIDGTTRNENDWQDKAAYGIRVTDGVTIDVFGDYVTLDRLDIGGTAVCSSQGACAGVPETGIAVKTQAGRTEWRTGNIYRRLYIHNSVTPIHSRENGDVLMEYCWIGPTFGKEALSHQYGHNWIIRHCYWIDNCANPNIQLGTGVIGAWEYSGGQPNEDGAQSNDWRIYGCVFGGTNAWTHGITQALVFGRNVSGWRFYNNTIYNHGGNWGAYVQMNLPTGGGTNNIARNNLFAFQRNYNDENSFKQLTGLGGQDVSHSWLYKGPQDLPYHSGSGAGWMGSNVIIGSEDPFIDAANHDYRLKSTFSGNSPLGAGLALGAGYDAIDRYGVTRGAASGGGWDIGAFERAA